MKKYHKKYINFLKKVFLPKTMYATVNEHSLGRVIGFYALTALYFSILVAFGGLVFGTHFIEKKVDSLKQYAINIYPEDLVLNFTKDGLEVNKDEPFSIPIEQTFSENQVKNLVTFRTTLETTTKDLEKSDAFVVATKNKAYVAKGFNEKGQYLGHNILPYDGIGIIKVDKALYEQKVIKLAETLDKVMPWVVFIAAFFALTMFFILNMLMCLLFAFVVILISMLKGWQFNYEEGFKLALMATLPALFLGLVLSIWGLNFPMKNLVILIVFVFIIIPKNTFLASDNSLAG